MSKEELHNSLEALKAEIENLDGAHEDVRERVTELIADVESQIDEAETPNDNDESLSDRVAKFVEQMEIEHPITETLNRFLTTLGEMGI